MKFLKVFTLIFSIIMSASSSSFAMNRELYNEMEEQIKEMETSLQNNTNFMETFKRTTESYLKKRKIVVDDLKKQLSNNKMELYKLKKEMEILRKEVAEFKKLKAQNIQNPAMDSKTTSPVQLNAKNSDEAIVLPMLNNNTNKPKKVDILYIRKNKNSINNEFKDDVKKFSKDPVNSKNDRIEASFVLGNIYLTEKDYENASVFFSEAFKMDSKSIWAGKSMLNIGDL